MHEHRHGCDCETCWIEYQQSVAGRENAHYAAAQAEQEAEYWAEREAEHLNSLASRDQDVQGVPADVEITGRSWDPKAAGARAVDKHGDALRRLSDEETE